MGTEFEKNWKEIGKKLERNWKETRKKERHRPPLLFNYITMTHSLKQMLPTQIKQINITPCRMMEPCTIVTLICCTMFLSALPQERGVALKGCAGARIDGPERSGVAPAKLFGRQGQLASLQTLWQIHSSH